MAVTTTQPRETGAHAPSAPPDPKAWFSRLAAFSARRRRVRHRLLAGRDVRGRTAGHHRSTARCRAPAGRRKGRPRNRSATSSAATSPPSAPRTPSSSTSSRPRSAPTRRACSRSSPRSPARLAPPASPTRSRFPPTAGLISPDGRTAIDPRRASGDERCAAAGRRRRARRLRQHSSTCPPARRPKVTGEWPVWSDFNHINEQALHKAELLSGLPSLILLFVAFGTMIAAGLPLLLARRRHRRRLRQPCTCSAAFTPLSVWSMNFSMMIGLAVGIDYSLFIVSRYREERVEGKDAIAAIENTMSTAGKAVFLSALTVVLSLAAVFLVPVMVFRSMALGMILSVVAVAVAALTLLPAVLVALGDRVLITQEHGRSRHHRREPLAARGPAPVAAPARHRARHRARRARRAHRPRARDAPRHARRARRRHRATPAATATTCSSTRSGPARPRPRSSPRRRTTPARVVDIARPPCRRRRRPDRHAARGDRPRRRARHRLDAGRRLPHRRRWSTRCAPTSHTAVPDAQRRRTRRAEPRPHHRAHRTGALRDRADPHRRVRAVARRVPQPRRRAHVDPA